jgi:hypothetical protein
MKIAFLFQFLVLSILVSCSKQGTEMNDGSTPAFINASAVPAGARTAFNSDFSGADGVEWQRNSSNSFTVQFNHSSQRHSAGYDDNGRRSSHHIICTDGPVPQVILDAFRQQYPADTVYEWKLRNDGTWKAHIMRGAVKYEATFSAAGVLLKFERSL